MLIPIGSWCRTAYQVKQFLFDKNVKNYSYPYDWTITPFSALKRTLNIEFLPEHALMPNSLSISKFGSIIDEKTSIIHHHDLHPKMVLELSENGEVNAKGVPIQLFRTNLMSNVQGRFRHTYQNLLRLRNFEKKLGFIRWNRLGHPDSQLPEAFQEENLESLSEIICKFLGHENFSILQVVSDIKDSDFKDVDIIKEYSACEYGAYAVIRERKGFDGDGTNNFKGDTKSWNLVLSMFVSDCNIPINYSLINKLTNTCGRTVKNVARTSRRFLSSAVNML